ncbi:MAG: polysulfide reductase NrfD [Eggerthellaceae bacterium]|nr:polysulfide reductase NrfD [Eggerthellaceae bacterium]
MTISALAAAYLFFGGAGAGTLFFAVLTSWLRLESPQAQRAADRGLGVGLAFLVVGAICLIFDLGRPDQALLLFFNPTWSFLTVGSYLLVALMLLAGALLVISLTGAGKRWSFLLPVLRGLLLVCAVGVMVYTGLLLRDLRPIPLWSSWWLPVLFLFSSLAAGAAVCFLCASPWGMDFRTRRAVERRFAGLDILLVAGEVVAVLLLMLLPGTPLGPASESLAQAGRHALLIGLPGALFVGGFGLCAVACPFAGDVLAMRGASREHTLSVIALASILGCFCLRMALVLAGLHVGV